MKRRSFISLFIGATAVAAVKSEPKPEPAANRHAVIYCDGDGEPQMAFIEIHPNAGPIRYLGSDGSAAFPG